MPTPKTKTIRLKIVEQSIKNLLEGLGFDLKDQDLNGTPRRAARLLVNELSPERNLKRLLSTEPTTHDAMVVMCRHRTFSRCPHHLERVILDISIGYIPDGQLIGLSKLPRIADYFCRGLMLQEEIVSMIAEGLMDALKPKGVVVIAEGTHMCMQARGVKTRGRVITSKLTGCFLKEPEVREEFFHLLREVKV
jgi:GTP cyclohydrolase IA